MKPTEIRRRVRHDERGVALIVVLGAIMVISIFVAVAFAAAVHSNTATYQERTGKQAFAAALAGLRTGVYRLNTSGVANDKCPTYTVAGAPTTNPTNGLCGAYSSTDTGIVQASPQSRFTYWITPDFATPGITDECTGLPPFVISQASVQDRCITAVGQAIDAAGNVTATRRVQARLVSGGSFFPVPGIWGSDCVQVGKGGSGAVILGAIGSNGRAGGGTCNYWTFTADIDLNVSTWGDTAATTLDTISNPDPKQQKHVGADVYYGRSGPSKALPTAQIVFQATARVTNTAAFPYSTQAGTCPIPSGTQNKPPILISAMFTANCAAPVLGKPQDLKRQIVLPPVAPMFQAAPAPARGAATYGGSGNVNTASPTGTCRTPPTRTAAPCDTSRKNDNNVPGAITLANCAAGTYSSTLRVLDLKSQGAGNCVATLKNGVYNFCSIKFAKSTSIRAADTSANGEVYVFVDKANRNVLPSTVGGADGGAACDSSTDGNMSAPTGAGSGTSFMANATTSLAGQLYFYGDGETLNTSTGSWVGNASPVSHKVVIPNGWQFKGLVYAPNSWIDLNPNVILQGGINARAVQVENGAEYAWDVGVTAAAGGLQTFYRDAFEQCRKTIPVVGGAQQPMLGC
jgi:Tfp pilus assembly protein PilX